MTVLNFGDLLTLRLELVRSEAGVAAMVVVALGLADPAAKCVQQGLVLEILLHVLQPAPLFPRWCHRHLLEVDEALLEVGQLAPPLLRPLPSLELTEAALHKSFSLLDVAVAGHVYPHILLRPQLCLHHHLLAHPAPIA